MTDLLRLTWTFLWLSLLCVGGGIAANSPHLRGRLAGIELISYHTGPMLGNAESGIVASLFSVRASVISGGIFCVIGTGLLMLAMPAFRNYDGRDGLVRKREEDEALKVL